MGWIPGSGRPAREGRQPAPVFLPSRVFWPARGAWQVTVHGAAKSLTRLSAHTSWKLVFSVVHYLFTFITESPIILSPLYGCTIVYSPIQGYFVCFQE